MKRLVIFPLLLLCSVQLCFAQQHPKTPDQVYGQLFIDVQMQRIFPDNKTFVDCVPKDDPTKIVADYTQLKQSKATIDLKQFVLDHFNVPSVANDTFHSDMNESMEAHIKRLWNVLKHTPDKHVEGSSLLPLPYPYIFPGGRFKEIYYWDSYFTMLGLQASGEDETLQNMVNNFAYMLQQYGHIPNGSRTYYLSRSQPPFFSMMLDLLAAKKGNSVYAIYKSALQREYDYYNDKTAPTKHIVTMPDGSKLTRYYDQSGRPRQESFYEDSVLDLENKNISRADLYRNLRSCAESGWDFSTRWFKDGEHLKTIQVTNTIPVDLNCLMYHLELSLAKAYKETGNMLQYNYYNKLAAQRKAAINKYCYNKADGFYYDYIISTKTLSKEKTIAGSFPLFFDVAPKEYAAGIAENLKKDFLKDGGLLTTLKNSGEQWDAPNGWAPLEFMAIKGLDDYGMKDLAKDIATRWVDLNNKVYKATGKLMEKYNVADTHLTAGGGEYPSQDGFGWTNGVALKLMSMYGIKEE
jgi:alpha,alpha-trehalase